MIVCKSCPISPPSVRAPSAARPIANTSLRNEREPQIIARPFWFSDEQASQPGARVFAGNSRDEIEHAHENQGHASERILRAEQRVEPEIQTDRTKTAATPAG